MGLALLDDGLPVTGAPLARSDHSTDTRAIAGRAVRDKRTLLRWSSIIVRSACSLTWMVGWIIAAATCRAAAAVSRAVG